MKTIIAFAFVIVSITAVPFTEDSTTDLRDERLITGTVNNIVQLITNAIREAGLDPLHIENKSFTYALPVPELFSVATHVDFKMMGISHMVVKVNYAPISRRLTFDIEWPLINVYIGTVSMKATVFGQKFDLNVSGNVKIPKVRIQGTMRLNIGISSGISVRSIDVLNTVGDVNSDLDFVMNGKDYSNDVNKFISSTIPAILTDEKIKIFIETTLVDIINAILKK